ncbi:hypothetical protein BS639_17285 [Rouxiella silvae]|uniref:Uncharacterized protein n=1 Tax=Rouxiella silvae TaxID=1646373 RepID=A0ABX3TXR6_9GAMM|nr:hypothetical protein [Rouxiella silvae]ORJ20047.1 hypothetical protein BS639_17285 [Rouxiella silvae]
MVDKEHLQSFVDEFFLQNQAIKQIIIFSLNDNEVLLSTPDFPLSTELLTKDIIPYFEHQEVWQDNLLDEGFTLNWAEIDVNMFDAPSKDRKSTLQFFKTNNLMVFIICEGSGNDLVYVGRTLRSDLIDSGFSEPEPDE